MDLLIRKRNGIDVPFDKSKIARALEKANVAVALDERLSIAEIVNIADSIEKYYVDNNTLANVESVQDMVINKIMECGKFKLAKEYITYRYQHELLRKGNSIDEEVFQIVNGTSEEIREENSNKNTDILPTQRDYIAGIVSKDITDRYLLPSDILQAHNDGLIHFHDKDYFVTKEHNCGLVNLDDMLQNGTVISETKIDRPHRFSTACNIATQIIAQVASSQYGGQSITLTHIAKFVDVSRQAIRKEVINELDKAGVAMFSDEQVEKIVEMRLRKEVNAGIQTIQYQVLTLMTTNGQTPFITVFLNLSEAEGDKVLEKDLAMCIEEVLLQRIQGIKNEVGVYVTPAFPKLIYVLDENNVYTGSPYRYLTELAAKCTAKQMVPDYISAKMMRQLKGGDVYTCMGCTDKDAVISYILNGIKYTESFEKAWERCAANFDTSLQANTLDSYMDLQNVKIWDSVKNEYVDCYRMIRNHSERWMNIHFANGRMLRCTDDHPFETVNRGVVLAKNLCCTDQVMIDYRSNNIGGDGKYDQSVVDTFYDSIPNQVFNWDLESRIKFIDELLADAVDHDNYFTRYNESNKQWTVGVYCSNKAFANQILLLMQSVGVKCCMTVEIRYLVTAIFDNIDYHNEILEFKSLAENHAMTIENAPAYVTGIIMLPNSYKDFSYDVTTASEHFTVDGIYSHNCRSFLTPDRFTDTLHENIANALNWDPTKHKYYGRLTTKVKSTINRVNALSMRCA